MRRIRRVVRSAIACAFALAATTIPISQVAACLCAGGELPVAIPNADVAFVGVAEATADGPPADNQRRTLYTFSVERASRETGPTIEVAAWAGSGSSCGIDFGMGERWVVLATRWEGALDTNLCSGNLRVDDLEPAQRADLPRLLPIVPEAAQERAPEQVSTALERVLPAIAVGVAVLALVGAVAVVGIVAGRRNRDGAP
jgi:hypothetical protein